MSMIAHFSSFEMYIRQYLLLHYHIIWSGVQYIIIEL